MGILDNLENAWDDEFDWGNIGLMPEFESNPIVETDSMGREIFWKDIGRPESLAVKLFSETCCSECQCGK
jgi:hypothetical protein